MTILPVTSPGIIAVDADALFVPRLFDLLEPIEG